MNLPKILLGGLLAALTVSQGAQAALSVSGSVGGAPTGVTRDNLDALPLGGAGGTTATGIVVNFMPNGQAVQGSVSGVYAAPFLSGGNGNGFGPGGSNQADGPDTSTYITSGSTGTIPTAFAELILPSLQRYFGLLWGSVDDYNTLSFYNGNQLVGSITGADVTASPNGNQGVQGTLYVNVNSTLDFNRVVATSSQEAFEFDNVAYNPSAVPVPEPASLALFGAGLLGLGFTRRLRRRA